LIVAEAFGLSNTSQILDLEANTANMFTPAYAIYEGGNLARVALFNYISDPTGASQYTATINVQGAPAEVKVKYAHSFFLVLLDCVLSDVVTARYFLAPSVSNKDNITWAGQVRI
jgi:Glycosyl hydrolase family 79 C-terminal beta domain